MRLMPLRIRSSTLMPLAALAIAGCTRDDDPVRGEALPLTHASAHDDAIANVRAMLDLAWRSEKFLAESETLDRADNIFMSFASASGTGEAEYEDEEEVPRGIVLPLEEVDFDETKRSFEDFLEAAVFREEQIESRTATSITYRLSPDVFCDSDDGIDPDCVASVQDAQLRVVATSVVEGDINLTVLASEARHEVATFELHADLLALTFNVGPMFDALVDTLRVTDPETEPPEVIKARGSVRASLRRLSTDAMRIGFEVVSPIEVEVDLEDDEVKLEAGAGLVALDVDAGAGTAVVEADLRDLALQSPKAFLQEDECYDADGNYIECPELDGTASIALGRLAGSARLIDTAERGTIEGLIAGPLTAKLDHTKLIELTLNDDTAPIDVLATTTPDLLSFTIDGAAQATGLFELREAEELEADYATGWAASDFLKVVLGADQTKFSVVDSGFLLDAGTIAVSSRSRPDLDVTYSAGQCVVRPEAEGDEVDPHPFELAPSDICFEAVE